MGTATYRKVDVDGVNRFLPRGWVEGRANDLPLHGFPTVGHMFRDLIPQLADRFLPCRSRLPGFGQSDMPARSASPQCSKHRERHRSPH
jgi:pimeloyl-ACP methyl ester carboxylesterase